MTILCKTALAAACCVSAMAAAAAGLDNAGFENGTTGWTFTPGSGSAAVTTDAAYSGVHAAAVTGLDASIGQTFSAVAVSSITELSLMAMSAGGAFDQVVFSYADGSTSTSAVFGLGDAGWTKYDLTGDLTAGAALTGIAIYGALGQTNYIDDVNLAVAAAVPEAGALPMFAAGLAVIGLRRRAAAGR